MTDYMRRENIEDVFPMSDIQLGMFYHSLKDPEAAVYHGQLVSVMKDDRFDRETLEKALHLMVEKHPILRTGFDMNRFKEPVQIVFREIIPDYVHQDITHLDKARQREYIYSYSAEDRKASFNLDHPMPLWRVRTFGLDGGSVCFMWIRHHAITDGWSSASLMTELNNTYVRLKSDPGFLPGKLKSTYKQFVLEQRLEKKSEANVRFWREELRGYKRLAFPGGGDRGAAAEKKYSFSPGEGSREQLTGIARASGISLKNICFAAYVYMLSMLSYSSDILVGLVAHNRPVCEDGDKILGCFLNTVPVRIKIPPDICWSDFLRLVDRKLLELSDYNRLPLMEIVNITGITDRTRNPFFDTLFNFVDFHVYGQASGHDEEDSELEAVGDEVTNTLFNCNVLATGGRFMVGFFYRDPVISDEWAKKLHGYYQAILAKFIHQPRDPARKEEVLSQSERRLLLEEFNRTAAAYPGDKTVHQLFEEQARRSSHRTAVVYTAPGDRRAITYRQLNEEAHRLACVLKANGVQSGDIVGIMLERSIGMITGILAVLKAGGAYMPIDPGYPQERVDYMLTDSSAVLLLTAGDCASSTCRSLSLEALRTRGAPAAPIPAAAPATASSLAYIIYTSGTTGKPRGVMIEHRSVVRLMVNDKFPFAFDDRDVWTLFHSCCFDFSVWEMYGALLYGGKSVVITRIAARDPGAFLRVLAEEGVTVLNQTPSAFYNLSDEELGRPARQLKIKYVIFGGEALNPARLARWRQRYPRTTLINMYGITETTVHVTVKEIGEREIEAGVSNIGKPIPTLCTYIMDDHPGLLPIDVPGELCVGGAGVGRGYLNRPALTAEKFKRSPFKPQERLYRSGDLAKINDAGEMEYLGRIDSQVKIRGFRIEPGEIENRLREHDHIDDAVVLCQESEPGDKHLCAYIISDRELDLQGLREFLLRRLPDYMAPNYFRRIEKIPLTANGKLDRAALEPGSRAVGAAQQGADPSSEMEKIAAAAWKEILNVDRVGIYDNFFELGGDSVKVVRLNNRLNNLFGVKIPVAQMFHYMTIASFVDYLTRREDEAANGDGEGARGEAIDRGRRKRLDQRNKRRKVERINV
jgi:amino acid adenylation domain-containing protein